MLKYSIILPYYDRSIQFRKTLGSFLTWYDRDDYEVIIIEDQKNYKNNKTHEELKEIIDSFKDRINIKHFVYPIVQINPVGHYKLGVDNSSGEYLVFSNPECFHVADILGGFDKEFDKNRDVYVVCGCKGLEFSSKIMGWFQHSQHLNNRLHFCTALSRKQYNKSGGFPQEFADGYAFDDNAFRDILLHIGIEFVLRDDLLVIHQKHSKPEFTEFKKREKYNRNRKLYRDLFLK